MATWYRPPAALNWLALPDPVDWTATMLPQRVPDPFIS
jgi:hypothetical protein